MAKDELTYSEAVRAAAAEALGTNPEAVRPRAIAARRRPGNDGKARVLVPAMLDKKHQNNRPSWWAAGQVPRAKA